VDVDVLIAGAIWFQRAAIFMVAGVTPVTAVEATT